MFVKSMQPKATQIFKVIHPKILVGFVLTNRVAARHALIQFELLKERLHCVHARAHKVITLAPLPLVIEATYF